MPSDAFIGVLTGLAGAHRERQKNLFDQEVERREQMAKAYEKVAEHPSITPEGQEQYFRRAFEIRTLPAEKKMPKEWESFISEIAPKFGQSWLGGQTSRKVEAQPMPIGADLEGGTSLKQIEGGAVPGLQDKVQATRTPEPSQYQAPMPEPPPGTQRSAFYSPQEMSQQKISEAVQMLQALGPIQREQALETERAKLAMQPEEFFAVPAESGIAKRSTGELTKQPQFRPTTPDRSLSREEIAMLAAQGDPTAKQALQLLAQDQTGKTLFERLGPEAYYDMLQRGAEARAGVNEDTVNSYVNAINEGNITSPSQVPQVVRDKVLAQLGNGFIIAPGEKEGIRKIEMAGLLLTRLETYSKKVTEDPSDVESALVLRGLRQAVGGVFAKGIFAEAGVLTDYDIARVQALIPGITRSVFLPGTSEKQFAELRGIIEDSKKNYARSIGSILRGAGAPTPPPNERVIDFNSLPVR